MKVPRSEASLLDQIEALRQELYAAVGDYSEDTVQAANALSNRLDDLINQWMLADLRAKRKSKAKKRHRASQPRTSR